MEPWLIGMQLAMLGCFSSAIGLVLLKHSSGAETQLPLLRRRYFLLGIVFLIVNASVIDVVAFALAPITLVAPLTGVTIVFTSWLASTGVLFVKETLDVQDTISTGITLAGVTVTSIYGPHDSDVPDAVTAYKYFAQSDFLACCTFLLVVLALGWGAMGVSVAAMLRGSRDPKPASQREAVFRILLYAYTAALSGSMSMLLLKVIGSAIRARLEQGDLSDPSNYLPIVTPQWLMCLAGLAMCAVVQLGFLHRTLANSPVTYAVPTYQTLLTLLTILLGGIFFSEFQRMGVFQRLVFTAGVGCALFGIALHTTHRSQASHQAHDQPPPAEPHGGQGGVSLPGGGIGRGGLPAAVEEGAVPSSGGLGSPEGARKSERSRLLG